MKSQITKWSISSDGTPAGTKIMYDGQVLGDIMRLSINVEPDSLVVGSIEFVTRLEDCKITSFNDEIRDYVNRELTKLLGGSFA